MFLEISFLLVLKKTFVRYDEGAVMYSMGQHTFVQFAKEAGAVYHVK